MTTFAMATPKFQIDHKFAQQYGLKPKAGYRKWLRTQRNRKIRRVAQDEKPNIGYAGWEY